MMTHHYSSMCPAAGGTVISNNRTVRIKGPAISPVLQAGGSATSAEGATADSGPVGHSWNHPYRVFMEEALRVGEKIIKRSSNMH
jgi:hypothetical protein